MRLFFYYAFHSFKNQLRKLFKTWVLIFLLACMLIGGIIGAAAAPWALIAGTIAAFGFGCKLEIVKKDGSTDEIV